MKTISEEEMMQQSTKLANAERIDMHQRTICICLEELSFVLNSPTPWPHDQYKRIRLLKAAAIAVIRVLE